MTKKMQVTRKSEVSGSRSVHSTPCQRGLNEPDARNRLRSYLQHGQVDIALSDNESECLGHIATFGLTGFARLGQCADKVPYSVLEGEPMIVGFRAEVVEDQAVKRVVGLLLCPASNLEALGWT